MDARVDRIGRNEALFREVNERLQTLNEQFDVPADRFEFLCECGMVDCTDKIVLTAEEYRQLRSDGTTFAIVAGHEMPDVETVLNRNDRFAVVRKHPGRPAALARALDSAT